LVVFFSGVLNDELTAGGSWMVVDVNLLTATGRAGKTGYAMG
jgi:hypothetical protein